MKKFDAKQLYNMYIEAIAKSGPDNLDDWRGRWEQFAADINAAIEAESSSLAGFTDDELSTELIARAGGRPQDFDNGPVHRAPETKRSAAPKKPDASWQKLPPGWERCKSFGCNVGVPAHFDQCEACVQNHIPMHRSDQEIIDGINSMPGAPAAEADANMAHSMFEQDEFEAWRKAQGIYCEARMCPILPGPGKKFCTRHRPGAAAKGFTSTKTAKDIPADGRLYEYTLSVKDDVQTETIDECDEMPPGASGSHVDGACKSCGIGTFNALKGGGFQCMPCYIAENPKPPKSARCPCGFGNAGASGYCGYCERNR